MPLDSTAALSSLSSSSLREQRTMMSQMLSSALAGTTSLGIISSSTTCDWNLTHSQPTAAASSTMRRALRMSPSWLIPTSAMTNGGSCGPTALEPILMVATFAAAVLESSLLPLATVAVHLRLLVILRPAHVHPVFEHGKAHDDAAGVDDRLDEVRHVEA